MARRLRDDGGQVKIVRRTAEGVPIVMNGVPLKDGVRFLRRFLLVMDEAKAAQSQEDYSNLCEELAWHVKAERIDNGISQ